MLSLQPCASSKSSRDQLTLTELSTGTEKIGIFLRECLCNLAAHILYS